MLGASYPSKKALKDAKGQRLRYVETSLFAREFAPNGVNYVVGPDAYRNRKWYASVTCRDGIIVKVS